MKALAIIGLMGLMLVSTAAGQAKSTGNAPSSGVVSKSALAEIREIVHELEGRTDKLRELLSEHRTLVDQRPEQDAQQAKWSAALDRLIVRIQAAHAALIETTQRLDKAVTGELPTGLARDVARARNEAEPERQTAEQVLLKNKPSAKSKPAKQAPADKPSNNEEYDL